MAFGIALLIAGIILGVFIRDYKAIIKIFSRLTDGSIFLLLFFLGISVGMNEQIITNFQKIGLQSFIITILATMGSIFVSYFVYKIFFKST
ncbi:MAG: LysO family transporter [Bacteroidota bacterium]